MILIRKSLLVAATLFLCGFGYPPSLLMENVDTAWKAGRMSAIPTLIEEQLAKDPQDTTALFLLYSYFLTWEFDSGKAAGVRVKLEAIIFPIRDSITDKEEKEQFKEWLTSVFPPIGSAEPDVSNEQKLQFQKSVRELFKDQFPGTLTSRTNTAVLSRYNKEASKALRDDYHAFQMRKIAEIKKTGAPKLIRIAGPLGEGEMSEIPKDKWPELIRSLDPQRVFATPELTTIWFYRMGGTCDGVILHQKPEFKGDSASTKYTDFGDGVVWFTSPQ